MIFQKGWPWADLFNYHLLVMKEKGLMERLYHLDTKKVSKSCPNEYNINRVVKEPSPVTTNKIFSLCMALVIGFLASLLALIGENIGVKRSQSRQVEVVNS